MKAKLYSRTGPIKFGNVAKDQVLSQPTSPLKERLVIGSVEVGNSSGSDAPCGFGLEQQDAMWLAGQWDDSASASYTDDTTDAQDSGADDFALFTLTNDDGFVVQSDREFNIVGITVSTAEAGSPVYAYKYWNGSAWTALTTLAAPDYSGAGDTYLTFLKPHDWAALESSDTPVATDGLTAGKYAILAQATTAPTTAPLATELWAVELIDYVEAVGDGKSITLLANGEIKMPHSGPIVPYCGTADDDNWINIEFRKGF